MDGTTALDALVKAGDLIRYDRYRGQSGDDLLYLVFPSGRELHVSASTFANYGTLHVKVPLEKLGMTTSPEDSCAYCHHARSDHTVDGGIKRCSGRVEDGYFGTACYCCGGFRDTYDHRRMPFVEQTWFERMRELWGQLW